MSAPSTRSGSAPAEARLNVRVSSAGEVLEPVLLRGENPRSPVATGPHRAAEIAVEARDVPEPLLRRKRQAAQHEGVDDAEQSPRSRRCRARGRRRRRPRTPGSCASVRQREEEVGEHGARAAPCIAPRPEAPAECRAVSPEFRPAVIQVASRGKPPTTTCHMSRAGARPTARHQVHSLSPSSSRCPTVWPAECRCCQRRFVELPRWQAGRLRLGRLRLDHQRLRVRGSLSPRRFMARCTKPFRPPARAS